VAIKRKIFYYIFIIIGLLSLIYLMTRTFWEVQTAINNAYLFKIPLLKMSLWGLFFGILIEWKTLLNIYKGNVKVNWLIAPAILLSIVCFIPRLYWGLWFGSVTPFYIEMFKIPEIQMLLTAFSGILLVRSLAK
jgi:hypothetical protein